MSALSTLRLPRALLSDIYEHLVLELLELREIDTARQVLRTAEPMAAMASCTLPSVPFLKPTGMESPEASSR